jgi:DNA-3-methyladenine glycosylase I
VTDEKVTGEPIRCPWVSSDQIYIDYHDIEWGRELKGQRNLFEKISLEGFQSGLSWLTILKRREGFRLAFENFELHKVAAFDDSKIEELLSNTDIIRNRAKIKATVANAIITLDKSLDLTEILWSFAPVPSVASKSPESVTTSPESDALSKELKGLGFRFVGSTTMYALMQSTGIVKSHSPNCFLSA